MHVVAKGGKVQGSDGRIYSPGEIVPLLGGDVGRLLELGAVIEAPGDELDGADEDSGTYGGIGLIPNDARNDEDEGQPEAANDEDVSDDGGDIPEPQDAETDKEPPKKPKGRHGK